MEDNLKANSIGPKAPKDPVKKRSCIYIMLETVIEASPRSAGKPSQEIYLDNGRLRDMVKMTSGVNDDNILKLLLNCNGFRKLVHSIGVSVKSNNNSEGTAEFVMQNWGKVNIYETGTSIRSTCPLDGAETIINVYNHQWSEMDDVVGKIGIEFDNAGDIATATIRFFLDEGYEVPELELEAPVDYATEQYRAMISKSLYNLGNNKRLKTAIEKAKSGEDVTIAYIGGSITQGAGAKPINTSCYAYRSYLKFKELFGKGDGSNVHFIKAGVGGTPSELGMIRYERDVLRDGNVKPDIVIVEFAVNDEGDETKGECFESLCLKILSATNNPAVILLFSVFIDDYNLQDRLGPIGRYYNLPIVSVKDAVVEQFMLTKAEGNIISRRQYFYDVYHPTNDGHIVMADCLANLFNIVDKASKDLEDISIDKEPIKGNSYVNVRLIDKKDKYEGAVISEGDFSGVDTDLQMVEMDANPYQTPQFPNNWMHTAASGNNTFKLTIDSKGLIIVFKDSGSMDYGKAEVLVDGKLTRTLDPHENNWTHCNPAILYNEDISRKHDIEVRMVPGDEAKNFTILGFGYTK